MGRLTAEEAIACQHKAISKLEKPAMPAATHLDHYKFLFLLDRLAPEAILPKLVNHITLDELCALLAIKEHMGTRLTLYEMLQVELWKSRLAAKYSSKSP